MSYSRSTLPAERGKLGLDPDLPTGLLLFGGQGAMVMETILRRLDASDLKMQMIAVCGHNRRLFERVHVLRTRFPLHTVGFTKEVPRLMQLADFFIGKPGPGSISEAVHMKLPVIVTRNLWTFRRNAITPTGFRNRALGSSPAISRRTLSGLWRRCLTRSNLPRCAPG